MKRLAVVLLVVSALPVAGPLASPCAAEARAQGLHRAGVVVSFADGRTERFCVSFSEDAITGLEALRRTGLPLAFEDFGGGAVTVCRIDGEGCAHPDEPCFCRCRTTGAACEMWGYYRMPRGAPAWSFATEGAGTQPVRDGDVDGWRWGRHGMEGRLAPASTDLASICARGTQVGATSSPTSRGRSSPWATVVGMVAVVVVIGALAWLGVVVRRKQERDER